MSVNIKTTTGLKQLTGYNLTSEKVVTALGYTPANTNDLSKYLTITNASATYLPKSNIDTDMNAIDTATNGSMNVPTSYAVQQYFEHYRTDAISQIVDYVAGMYVSKQVFESTIASYESRIEALESALGTAIQMLDELNGEVI